MLYHLSKTSHSMKLVPRIPNNYFTKNGYEDNTTKRVCMCPDIKYCLLAIGHRFQGDKLYVHVPEDESKLHIIHNSSIVDKVPDGKISKEVWVTNEFKTRVIGYIKVGKPKGKDIEFKYGDNKTGVTGFWNYTSIEYPDIIK